MIAPSLLTACCVDLGYAIRYQWKDNCLFSSRLYPMGSCTIGASDDVSTGRCMDRIPACSPQNLHRCPLHLHGIFLRVIFHACSLAGVTKMSILSGFTGNTRVLFRYLHTISDLSPLEIFDSILPQGLVHFFFFIVHNSTFSILGVFNFSTRRHSLQSRSRYATATWHSMHIPS